MQKAMALRSTTTIADCEWTLIFLPAAGEPGEGVFLVVRTPSGYTRIFSE